MTTPAGKWWNKAWNPVEGCTPCSPACDHCWAQAMLRRFKNPAAERILFYPERLNLPRKNRKPTRYFVCNRSDWMHPDIPDSFILKMLAMMAECPQHTFYTLTKRLGRLVLVLPLDTPPKNLWVGVTAWDNESFVSAIKEPYFLKIQGFQTFVSLEPLLGVVNLKEVCLRWPPKPDWIIVGGENGPGARPMEPEWVKRIIEDCKALEIPLWFKQWGSATRTKYGVGLNVVYCPDDLPRQRPEGG